MTFYHVYADESRQDAHRYMLYGLVFVPRGEAEQALLDDIAAFREKENLTAEMKWGKVSKGMLHVYKRYADIFFAHPAAEFKCLVVDTHKIDYRAFHDNDRETAFFKFYYYALSRNLDPAHEYVVFADDRQTKRTLRWFELQAQVNYHWLRQGEKAAVVRSLQPVDSKDHDLLQLADLFIGAIGYDLDEYNTSEHRLEFVRHVAQRVGCDSLRTHWGRGTRFNVWKFRFPETRGDGGGGKQKSRHPS